MSQDSQSAERRAILPLATDTERLVATLMSPNATLNRRLSAAERLYTLMPTYIRRTLFEAAIKLTGKEALTGEGKAADKDARRGLFRDALKSMLEAMEETREKIVEVKLPPITIPENLPDDDVPGLINSVAKALSSWFYEATEEARKEGKPYTEDPSAPGYIPLITFASLVIVNGLRQLALIGE
jgi:hypothetical protein